MTECSGDDGKLLAECSDDFRKLETAVVDIVRKSDCSLSCSDNCQPLDIQTGHTSEHSSCSTSSMVHERSSQFVFLV